MTGISSEQMDRIKMKVKKEFPHDEALPQVHIARKILTKNGAKS